MILDERLCLVQPPEIKMLFDEFFLENKVAKFVKIYTFYEIISFYKVYYCRKRKTGHCRSPLGKILSNLF